MSLELKSRILLVDDHPENLWALEAVLEDLGQPLVKAASAQEALRHLMHAGEDFAVIILDVQMPDISGFETARLIRQREKTRTTPIIFLTADMRSDLQVARGYETGAVDYLFKPFDPVILRAKVAVFVELAKKTRALEAEIERRRQAEAEVKQLNLHLEQRIAERTAHVEALNRRLQQLMNEAHDRVRNNLQLLAAMLDIQVMNGTASIPIAEIRRLGMHVRILSLVHDLLMEQIKEDATSYRLSVSGLLHKVIGLIKQTTRNGQVSLRVAEAQLPVREMTSLALITGELSGNAFRHGRGAVEITFAVQDGQAMLEICDNGPGFAADFDARHTSHTGLNFVEDLTRHDLNGRVRYETRAQGGACVVVTFPYPGSR